MTIEPRQTSASSPWDEGHSIDILRRVAAGITASVSDCTFETVDAGGVRAEWVTANGVGDDAPVALYFHGGAYLCGTLEQYRNATVGISRAAHLRVLSVDYRLAPEHGHPAAFEDALCAYRWLLDEVNVSADRLIVAGDSAGASIAVGVVMDALQLQLPTPACVITNSPFADLALASESLDDPARNIAEPNKQTIQWLARTYLEAGGPDLSATDARHSPIYRDLTGLPPLLVQTAGLDNLQDDGWRLAAQAEGCGVTTYYTNYASAGHIWIVLLPPQHDANVAAAFAEIQQFVATHVRGR